MDCIFCKIIEGKIPAKIAYQDDLVIAIDDIQPQAPIHKLIIPKQHIPTINDLENQNTPLIGHMVQVAKALAKEVGIADNGYRLVFNCNEGGGQAVYHIHLHLLGGRSMQWPPG